jgi:energy-coupling factor transporter ATP-binding protein EcfA2
MNAAAFSGYSLGLQVPLSEQVTDNLARLQDVPWMPRILTIGVVMGLILVWLDKQFKLLDSLIGTIQSIRSKLGQLSETAAPETQADRDRLLAAFKIKTEKRLRDVLDNDQLMALSWEDRPQEVGRYQRQSVPKEAAPVATPSFLTTIQSLNPMRLLQRPQREPVELAPTDRRGDVAGRLLILGAPGSGKTTLVNLLPRFYDPQAGQILIDGEDIATVTLKSLRRQIGIVPQETVLFSDTIAENIAFGQTEFDLSAMEAAAKVANAHDFISQFSQGYYAWVGERGVNLSGGQRQRIEIARAVLLNPRILILDEATSALDSESENLVQEALERLMGDHTAFIIAHRLATVRNADLILVLEKGHIVESGTHEALLARGDRYAYLHSQQFQA